MIPNSTPERAAPDHRGALAEDRERLIGGDHVRLIRVVLGDVRREVDLAERGSERLAHLPDDDGGQLLSAFPMELGRAADDPRPLGDRKLPPGDERRMGFGERPLDLGIGEAVVAGHGLPRGRVHDGVVAHDVALH